MTAEAKAETTAIPTEKAHCPTCNRSQNCDRHGRVYKPWEWSDRDGHSMVGGVYRTLFECRGCNTVFYETSSWDENDIEQWYGPTGETESEANYTKDTLPKPPSRPRPDWFDVFGILDPTLNSLLDETYKADEAGCRTLSAVGLRAALDNCFEALKIPGGDTFEEKLEALKFRGYIGDTEHSLLTVLVDAGSAAAHRGWTPERQHVHQLMSVLENFIQRVFVNGQAALAMKAGIPQRQPRTKKAKKPKPPAAVSPPRAGSS